MILTDSYWPAMLILEISLPSKWYHHEKYT